MLSPRVLALSLTLLALLVAPLACKPKTPPAPTPGSATKPTPQPKAQTHSKKPGAAKTSSFTVFARPAFAQAPPAGAKQVTISDIAERAVRSVVNVRSTKSVAPQRHPLRDLPFFDRDPRYRRPPRQARSLGSGVIVSADGIVLTNHHVVRHADEIRVTLANDDQEYRAKVIGSDPKSDVAVLRIESPPKGLVPLPLGDSSKARLGEVVLAIGNPFGVGQTVTMGIISALGRANVGIVAYEDFIQTDAAINPGNSGGALVSMRGELLGINTAILSRSGGYQGIGFAIPMAMVKPIMESLLKHGRVIRGWLGVGIQNLDQRLAQGMGLKVKRGVLLTQVQPGSPAEAARLQRGDVITAIDDKPIRTPARLRNLIAQAGVNKTVKLRVVRGDKTLDVNVKLGELPSEKVARFERNSGGLGGLTLETITDAHRTRLALPRQVQGVVVTAIAPRGAAASAGLAKDDVIVELNRRRILNTAQFMQGYRATRGRIVLLIYRGGTPMYVLLDK